MRTHRTKFGLALCMGLAAALQLSCSSEPTANDVEPSFDHGPNHLTISGPSEITAYVSASYTYTAYMSGVYVRWGYEPWAVRYCPTLSVSSCTTTWNPRTGTVMNENWNKLTTTIRARDCTGGGTKSFQVRAQAWAFGQGTVTNYKVTKLCGTEIN
jgi:hypothetical protein